MLGGSCATEDGGWLSATSTPEKLAMQPEAIDQQQPELGIVVVSNASNWKSKIREDQCSGTKMLQKITC
jgi:hypothetical protein